MLFKKLKKAGLVTVAVATSPCCTPLYVPIALALLAGTPVAIWATNNLIGVYAVLTTISVITTVLFVYSFLKKRQTPISYDLVKQGIKTAVSGG